MASSSGCPDSQMGTQGQRHIEEWSSVTSNINDKLVKLGKDNDDTLEEMEDCFDTLTEEVHILWEGG